MARMKGLSEWRIVLRHAARNALLPVVTAFALGARRSGRRQRGRSRRCSAGRASAALLVDAVPRQRLSAGAGRVPVHRARADRDELHRRPALRRPRSPGGAWPTRPADRAGIAGQARSMRRASGWAPSCAGCICRKRPLRHRGRADLRRVRSLVAIFADAAGHPRSRCEILFRRTAASRANLPPSLELPARHHQSRARHLLPARATARAARCWSGSTAAVVVVAIGTLVGLLSGYFGGWVDQRR